MKVDFKKLREEKIRTINKVFKGVENEEVPIYFYILSLLFIIYIRIFLEISLLNTISVFGMTQANTVETIGWALSYIFAIFGIALILTTFTNNNINKVFKVVVPFSSLIILSPIIDFLQILIYGASTKIGYFTSSLPSYITFLGNMGYTNPSLGSKVVIFLFIVLSFIYVYSYSKNYLKALLSGFIIYNFIYISFAMPVWLEYLYSFLSGVYIYTPKSTLNAYAFLIFLLFVVLYFRIHKGNLSKILSAVRLNRLIHFNLMFFAGFGLAVYNSSINGINLYYFFYIPLSVTFAWMHIVLVNNYHDKDVDAANNKKREFINLSTGKYILLCSILLFGSVFFGMIVSYEVTFFILYFIGIYHLYSTPPLRFKRVPFFSKLTISSSSLALLLMGYMVFGASLEQIPKMIYPMFLIGFTGASNFIDIKDYKGDLEEGLMTLPTLFGMKTSKIIIGSFFAATYLSVYFLFNKIILLPFLVAFAFGMLLCIVVLEYNEQNIFNIYLASVILLILMTTTSNIWNL